MITRIPYTIAQLADVHVHDVVAIYNEEQRLGDAALHTTPITPNDCMSWLAGRDGRFGALVCAHNDVVVGWSALVPFDSGSAYDHTAQLVAYVSRRVRHQGIGTRLLAAALEMADERGFHGIAMLLPSEPEWRTTWLRRYGFRRAGELEAALCQKGKWVDLSVLQLLFESAHG
jgi:phosphinothricin acetyltransferase